MLEGKLVFFARSHTFFTLCCNDLTFGRGTNLCWILPGSPLFRMASAYKSRYRYAPKTTSVYSRPDFLSRPSYEPSITSRNAYSRPEPSSTAPWPSYSSTKRRLQIRSKLASNYLSPSYSTPSYKSVTSRDYRRHEPTYSSRAYPTSSYIRVSVSNSVLSTYCYSMSNAIFISLYNHQLLFYHLTLNIKF